MKRKMIIPILMLILVTLACDSNPLAASEPEATLTPTPIQLVDPTDTPQSIPTAKPTDTSPPPTPTSDEPTAEPVPTDTPSGPVYFREEFDNDINWTFEYITGNNQDQCVGPELKEGGLWWRCPSGQETHLKVYEEEHTYQDVVVQAEIENFGANANWVSLLCRVSDDGFYEFRFTSAGLYEIFRFDWSLKQAGKTPYVFIGGGATQFMNPGKDLNTVAMVCAGDYFEFYANGHQIDPSIPPTLRKEFTRITEGGVGIGFMVAPGVQTAVESSFLWFETLQPPQ